MKDEILDYDWVISHETKIEEAEATLFQQCISMDTLLETCGMLVSKNIPYQIITKENNLPTNWSMIYEIHVEEKNLEIGTMFLDLLVKRDSTYPNHEFRNYTVYELQRLYELDENSNPYKQALIEIELKRKGIIRINKPENLPKEISSNLVSMDTSSRIILGVSILVVAICLFLILSKT